MSFSLGMVLYGMISFAMFIIFLSATAWMYDTYVSRLFYMGCEDGDIGGDTLRLLGVRRSLLLICFSVAWPATIFLLFAWYYMQRGGSFCDLPPTMQQILLWTFLGFGKFIPMIDSSTLDAKILEN